MYLTDLPIYSITLVTNETSPFRPSANYLPPVECKMTYEETWYTYIIG